MSNYYIYSTLAHIVLISFLFLIGLNRASNKQKQYYIDFIGESKIETIQNPSSGQDKKEIIESEAKKKADINQKENKKEDYFDKDDFFKDSSNLRPSMAKESSQILANYSKDNNAGSSSSNSSINADSNFPYPWYITQIRELLWDSWRKIMPANSSLKCIITFKILRGGEKKDIEIEHSSGNRMFDQSALSAVENSDKFPSLPDDFYEDYLTVHVEFKNLGD